MIRGNIRRWFHLALRRRDRWEREVEDEIKLHLALRAEQLMAQGATANDAFAEAVRRFGPLHESRARMIDAARHRETSMQRTEYLRDLSQDLRFALRTLRRDKGWTAVTMLTLALGIGAATAVFSAVSTLLLHPVPYPDANRVVLVYQQPDRGNNTGVFVTITPSSPVIRAWKAGAKSFESLEAMAGEKVALRTSGEPVTLNAVRIEPTFPHFAGERPILGRMFTQAETDSDGRQAVLGEGLWRERFGADPGVLGKTITLDDSIYTVIGVLPARLKGARIEAPPTDVWLPLNLRPDNIGAALVGRLRPGVRADVAQQELDSVSARAARARNDRLRFNAVITTPAKRVSFHDSLVMLGYAVGLVLLVACANVAHLLLARSSSRRRELAIRAALGAGRARVFRQLLTESLVLAAVGGSLGVVAGVLGLRAIVALRPPTLSGLSAAHVDATTLGLALAVTLTTSIVFGVMGVVQSTRDSTHDALKTGGTHSGGRGRGRARQLLVVTEMALSATLVVGATMLVRSVINLQRADLGFQPEGLYALSLKAPKGHFPSSAAHAAVAGSVAARLAALPGVRSVALASTPPTWRSFSVGLLEVDGQPASSASTTAFIDVNQVQSGYFRTMGIALVEGTTFTDTSAAARQVIVNERFARKQWAGVSPLGHRLRVGKEPWLTIVGVARDAATGGPMLSESTAPYLYTPAIDSQAVAILIRTTGTADLLQRVQALARTVDPAVTTSLESVASQVSQSIAQPRFIMLLLALFTTLALALAAIGLYGVTAYTVSQRTREIGIRVALGATRTRIARAVVVGGVSLAMIGSLAGIMIARWGTKLIESQLYGVARSDIASFVASMLVLLLAGVAACVVPARRALAVDPMTAIRAD